MQTRTKNFFKYTFLCTLLEKLGVTLKKLALVFLFFSSLCWGDLQLLIGPEEIAQKIKESATKIDKEYVGKELTIVMVMKGAVCITADLIRYLQTPVELEYVSASSYGQNGDVRGDLKVMGLDNLDLNSKHVLIVDDIFDSGATMETIVQNLKTKNPKSVKSLVLLLKNVPRKTSYLPDYALFEIENHFVLGYGLDFKEKYRGLPGIYYFPTGDQR
jgi:hypoxanthine phosphoribosyltransferase